MSSSVKDSIASVRTDIFLTETEDSWDKICKTIISLTELIRSWSTEFPQEITAAAREFHRPINSALKSERTRLSGCAVDLIALMASELGTSFEPLLHLFFPTLLLLCGRTSKVVVSRARLCILSIIETTQLISVLPYLVQSIRDKSASLRVVAAEGTVACINSLNPPDLEKEERTRDIEMFIKLSVRDANPEVRKLGKQIYQAYELLFPRKAESFAAPLTPTSKKYLGLSSRLKSTTQQVSRPLATSQAPDHKSQTSGLVKKQSQSALSSNMPPTASSSRVQLAYPAQSSTSRSRPPSRPDSAADLHAIYPGPTKEERPLPQNVPLTRPHLAASRSESSAQHTRSASATSLTSGPIRHPNPFAHSTSKPTSTSGVPPQRTLVSSLPDPSSSTKATGAPLRVDPSAGRERNPPRSKKPPLPKLGPEEHPPVTVIRPDAEGCRSKPLARRPELPESTGSSRDDAKKADVVNAQTSRHGQFLVKKPSVLTLIKKDEPVPVPGVSQSLVRKVSLKQLDKKRDESVPVSTSQTRPHHQSTASSRARATSASAIARPVVSRTRAIPASASTGTLSGSSATNPPGSRTRTVSGAASSSSTAARAQSTALSKSTGTVPKTSKAIWDTSAGTHSAGQASSKTENTATKNGRAVKQKRPSVVPEEVDEPSVLKDSEVSDGDGEEEVEEAKEVLVKSKSGEEAEEANGAPVEYEGEGKVDEGLEDAHIQSEAEEQIGDETENVPVQRESEEQSGEGNVQSDDSNPRVVGKEEGCIDEAPLIEFSNVVSVDTPIEGKAEPSVTPVALHHVSDLTLKDVSPEAFSAQSVEVVINSSSPQVVPHTPVRSLKAPELAFDGQPTPISALLSSIQRGFLFTPATPLSPPDSYLPKDGTAPVIPFPLFSNREPGLKEVAAEDQSDDSWRQPRQALETMDMN